MRHVIGRDCTLLSETARVLRDQHETWVRTVVDAFRPGVANTPADMVGHAFVESHEQTIPLLSLLRIGLEIHGEAQESTRHCATRENSAADAWGNHWRSAREIGAIHILQAGAPARVMERQLPTRIRLIHVVETAQ